MSLSGGATGRPLNTSRRLQTARTGGGAFVIGLAETIPTGAAPVFRPCFSAHPTFLHHLLHADRRSAVFCWRNCRR